MPTETLIERAFTLIQMNRTSEARPVLAELFRANMNDAEAWALAAEIAPTPETREQALRKVTDLSEDNRLAEWAITELSRMKGMTVTVRRTAPPLPTVPESWEGSAAIDTWSRAPSPSLHRDAVELPPIAPAPAPPPSQSARQSIVDETGRIKGVSKPLPSFEDGAELNTNEIVRIVAITSWILGIALGISAVTFDSVTLFGSKMAAFVLAAFMTAWASWTLRLQFWRWFMNLGNPRKKK